MTGRWVLPLAAVSACAVAVLGPLAALQTASAAQLHVTAAPIQTWKLTDGLPELPEVPVDLSACGDPEEYDEIVLGTPDDDVLEAGNGRQILVGLAGDDLISGGNHDDCLLGGAGDDTLRGGNGKDVLVGGWGADDLDGGNGRDQLDAGGDEGDTCLDDHGLDELVGCGAEPVEGLAATEEEAGSPAPSSAGQGEGPSGEPDHDGTPGPAPADPPAAEKPQPRPGPAAEPEPAPAPPAEEPAQEPAAADETQVTVP